MNWDLLCYLLENFSIARKKNRCFTSADRILLLEETSQDLPDTVYLTEGNIPCPAFENALIIHGDADLGSEYRIVMDQFIIEKLVEITVIR